MHRGRLRNQRFPRCRNAVWVLLLAGAALGCNGPVLRIIGQQETRQQPSPRAEAGNLEIYLETMRDLANGDLALQAEVFQRTTNAYLAAPTTVNRLRLALALATSGHASSDPVESQRMLLELLATPEIMLPAERALAEIHLKGVEQRLVLEVENLRLRESSTHARHADAAASAERLQTVLQQNEDLRRALNEAKRKLNAVTSIEREISERTENSTSRDNE